MIIKNWKRYFESKDERSANIQEVKDVFITMCDLGFTFDIRLNYQSGDVYSYKCSGMRSVEGSGSLEMMGEGITWVNDASMEYFDCIQRLESMGYDVSYTLLQSSYHRNYVFLSFNFDINKKVGEKNINLE